MTASKLFLYEGFELNVWNQVIDPVNDTFKIALFTSSSNAETLTVDQFANLTNQVAAANGYTSGGNALTFDELVQESGSLKWKFENTTFEATGGNIVARFAVIYSDTAANKNLVGYYLLDPAPADITIVPGIPVEFRFDADGLIDATINA
jgi:hypothetical protein